MKKTVDVFLYPNELLQENKDLLIERYVEDYGEEYRSIIQNRMDNTLYLFDSNPIATMEAIKEFDSSIDSKKMDTLLKEYLNYKKVYDSVHKRMIKKYYHFLSSYFSVPSHPIREELLSLDIEAYSLKNLAILQRSGENPTEKEKILKRQEKYRKDCRKMGINPLTNSVYIQFLLDEKMRIEEMELTSLLKSTKWGKRMIKTIRSYYPKASISEIQKIMRDDAVANTSYILDSRGCARARVLSFPLLQNYDIKSFDRIFYHENRHVVESNPYSSGLHNHIGNCYELLNEIRTENNALKDLEFFPDDFMWSSDAMSGHHNTYEELLVYVQSFFEEHRELLNALAIQGDLSCLEKIYGKKNLNELEDFLRKLSYVLKESNYQYFYQAKDDEAKTLVHRLNSHFHRQ